MMPADVELTKQDGVAADGPSGAAAASATPAAGTKKPKKDHFLKRLYRQNLNGYVPIPRPGFAIGFFAAMGAVLLGVGIALYVTGLNVQQEVFRYDNAGNVSGLGDLSSLTNEELEAAMFGTEGQGWNYTVTVTVQHDLKAPVYVYYRLGNYYQNYRRYINSANWDQLHGNNVSESALSVCDPIRWVYYNETTGERTSNAAFPANGLVNPCGLWPWSYFNDTYAFTANGQPLAVDSSNMAWSWQRDHLFGAYTPQNFNWNTTTNAGEPYTATAGGGGIQGVVNSDDRFMIWMRPEAHYTFQKLWGKIDQDIPANTQLEIAITNRYNMYAFGGLKAVVLSENSWMGGRNLFLGILMIVVGGLYWLAAAAFALGRVFFNRPLGDERYLSWQRMAHKKGFWKR